MTSPGAPSSDTPPRPSLRARARYWFDNGLSRGPLVVIGWLGLLTLLLIVVTAVVLSILRLTGVNGEGGRLGLGESLWQSMLRVVDAGTFAGDTGWPTRLVALLITVAGIFLAGSLIGLIANLVDQKVENLRKGRSDVLETGHTLVLGWSERVPTIVGELVVANESERRASVVVLAETDKTEMEDTLRDQVRDFRSTRLVCRSGSPSLPADLTIANLAGARSVVVVGESDASVIKTLLAVRSLDPGFTRAHVVVEVRDPETERSIAALFGERVVTVNSDVIVAELTAQACRQRGLSNAFRELLSFDGDEIYFAKFPELVGRTYAEAQVSFDTCAVLGLLRDGSVQLNPAPGTVLLGDDEVVAIAEDDSTFLLTGVPADAAVVAPSADDDGPEGDPPHLLVVGWSELGPRVVAELDEFVQPGTRIDVVVDPQLLDPATVLPSVSPVHAVVEVRADSGGPEDTAHDAVGRGYEEVIVLGYRDHLSAEEADARTLLTLVAFDQAVAHHELDVRLVAELLDQRHTPLAMAAGVDDFIVSDELTSRLIAQLSERLELGAVFQDLFDKEGSVFEMRPAAAYGAERLGTFDEVVRAASRRGHSAVGYQRVGDLEVVLNPQKSEPLQLGAADTVLVLR